MNQLDFGIKCNFCEKTFATPQHLNYHMVHSHIYNCKVCGNNYSDENEFIKHKETHLMYTCSVCQQKFDNQHRYATHCKSHFMKCTICNQAFPSNVDYMKHQEFSHGIISQMNKKRFKNQVNANSIVSNRGNSLKCGICAMKFETHYDLTKHADTHKFVCPHCQQSFQKSSYLSLHVQMTHKGQLDYVQDMFNKNSNAKCNLCGKAFVSVERLNAHKMYAHDGIRNFRCDLCEETFGSPSLLHGHKTSVHGKSFIHYTCKKCNKIFASVSALTLHGKSCKMPSNLQSFKCIFCKKATFNTAEAFKNHYDEFHKEDLAKKPPPKMYKCDICVSFTQFTKAYNLLLHYKANHPTTQLYKCEVCVEYFVHANDFNDHIKVVHDKTNLDTIRKVVPKLEEKLKCEPCDTVFDASTSFTNHVKMIHNENKVMKEENTEDDFDDDQIEIKQENPEVLVKGEAETYILGM